MARVRGILRVVNEMLGKVTAGTTETCAQGSAEAPCTEDTIGIAQGAPAEPRRQPCAMPTRLRSGARAACASQVAVTLRAHGGLGFQSRLL